MIVTIQGINFVATKVCLHALFESRRDMERCVRKLETKAGKSPSFHVNGNYECSFDGREVRLTLECNYMTTKKIPSLPNCPRCGFTHTDIIFRPITNPSGPSTHFALCPKTKAPILACFKSATAPAPQAPASEAKQVSTPPAPLSAALTDLSPMPWGKFKDVPMQDVPANYLHHFWTAGDPPLSQDKRSPVAAYIRRNLEVLKQEYTDGIW